MITEEASVLPRALRDEIRSCVDNSVERSLDGIREQLAENEPTITAQLAARLSDCLNEIDFPGFTVEVKLRVAQDRGKGAAEQRYGTDLIVVARLDTQQESIAKGVLVQAKRAGREGVHVEGQVRHRLEVSTLSPHARRQCRKMLRISPASFVWVYDESGVRTATASAMEATVPGPERKRIVSSALSDHVEALMTCGVGDTRLTAHDDATLDRLLDETDAQVGLLVAVEQPDQVDG